MCDAGLRGKRKRWIERELKVNLQEPSTLSNCMGNTCKWR